MRKYGKERRRLALLSGLTSRLQAQSAAALVTQGLMMVVLIGTVDYLTGNEFSVFIFYLLPVFMVTLGAGRNSGLGMAAASTGAWLIADILSAGRYSYSMATYWNAIVRLAFFSVMVILQDAFWRERNLARTDFLTSLNNRKMFYEAASVEIERSKRYGQPFSLAYLDIDNFKKVNDLYGHKAGDKLLKVVSVVIKRNIRRIDIAARLGGDEFAVLLPETGQEAADAVVMKLRNMLQQAMDRHRWPVTFSIGIASYETAPKSVDELVSSADDLMYAAKRGGKDRIQRISVVYDPFLPS
jgi:diguanylate cyclase (GGDEF)-like protein